MFNSEIKVDTKDAADALAEAHLMSVAKGHPVVVKTRDGQKMFWSGLVKAIDTSPQGCGVRLVGGRWIEVCEPLEDVLRKVTSPAQSSGQAIS